MNMQNPVKEHNNQVATFLHFFFALNNNNRGILTLLNIYIYYKYIYYICNLSQYSARLAIRVKQTQRSRMFIN